MSRIQEPPASELNKLIALYQAHRFAEAEDCARLLSMRFQNSGLIWKLLGAAQQMQGKNAVAAFHKTAELMPNDAESHFNLGVVQKAAGQFRESAASYRRALALKPSYIEALGNLGNVLRDMGALDESISCFRRLMALRPNIPEVHNNLGAVLKEAGEIDEAVASYHRALALKPDYADAFFNLGNALKHLGRLEEAAAAYRRATELRPSLVDALMNLGSTLKELDQPAAALDCYRKVAEIRPNIAELYNNMGVIQKALMQFDDATTSFQRALELKPDFPEAHGNAGALLTEFGEIDDAIEHYRRAIALRPGFEDAFDKMLFVLSYAVNFPASSYLTEARRYGQILPAMVREHFSTWRCADRPERLRIGVVSGDLRIHPVGHFLESVISHIDPARIELIAYPTSPKEDELTARIKPHFDSWRPLYGKDDETAARMIHADGTHVLLDLSGHTTYNRLPMFAWKPAPIQASWLGSFATTGVTEMDYFLADETGVPKTRQNQFTESIWYLPDTRLCFTPPDRDLPITPLPALSNGMITFGCFQNPPKLNADVLETWGKIFAAIPNARLRMQYKQLENPSFRRQLADRLQSHGISQERVTMHGPTSREEYLAAHADIDFILDTFPYPGGTTTCEALWMGVPTLTLAGDSMLSRQGASLMTATGLEDWIAASKQEYIDKAISFASDIPKLAALRMTLRQQVLSSPVFDAPRFARNLEDALWGMWQAYRDRNTQA